MALRLARYQFRSLRSLNETARHLVPNRSCKRPRATQTHPYFNLGYYPDDASLAGRQTKAPNLTAWAYLVWLGLAHHTPRPAVEQRSRLVALRLNIHIQSTQFRGLFGREKQTRDSLFPKLYLMIHPGLIRRQAAHSIRTPLRLLQTNGVVRTRISAEGSRIPRSAPAIRREKLGQLQRACDPSAGAP